MHCPPPLEGAGGGRGSGREVGVVYEYRSTIDTGDRGGGAVSASPLPVSPSPTGAILPSIQCHGRDPLSAVNVIALTEILSCFPWHCIRGYPPPFHPFFSHTCQNTRAPASAMTPTIRTSAFATPYQSRVYSNAPIP